jgi:hypothetical protein
MNRNGAINELFRQHQIRFEQLCIDYPILVSYSFIKSDVLIIMKKWCDEHIQDWGFSGGGIEIFFFKTKEDALMFKLIWGGNVRIQDKINDI